jgi:hypothetical protein
MYEICALASNHISTLLLYITAILLQVVQPLLRNGREIGGYTRGVSGQRLGKHVPIANKQIFNNATVGLQQWNNGLLRGPC